MMKKRIALICIIACMVSGQAYSTGFMITDDLRIDALIHGENSNIEAVFHKGGEDITARGDSVIWGYFYADPADVSWGSKDNPDVYVKIWFDISGRIDVSFFHVSVPEITVFSASPWTGTIYDNHDTLTTDHRYVRHEYRLRRWLEFYTYDDDGNMTREAYDRNGDGVIDLTRSYTFTKDGSTTIRTGEIDTDGDGITDYRPKETFTYDADGNLTRHEIGSSYVSTYTYDDHGNRTKAVWESERSVYDSEGNLTRRLSDTSIHTYTYDDRGNMTKDVHETESFIHDADGTLIKQESDGSVLTHIYDDRGNIIEKRIDSEDGITGEICTYSYDADENMTKEACSQQTELGSIDSAYQYTYDADGNMVEKAFLTKDGMAYSYLFTYDANGNLVKEEPAGENQGKIYADHTTYSYDADGNLIQKVITGHLQGDLPLFGPIPEDLPVGVYTTSSGMVVNIPPLPDAMKGYELYSWQADGEWNFTLISGTNRLKTAEDIYSAENVISEDGWVKITVRGVDALKAMLSQLPWKASVFWMNGGIPDLSFPDTETVNEIKTYCEERELSVFMGKADDDLSEECFNIYLPSNSLTYGELDNLDISRVALEPEPLISDEDITIYLQEEHIIHLTDAGAQKLKNSPRVRTGEAFFITVGTQPVYAGVFWSNVMSRPCDGIVIIPDRLLHHGENVISIDAGYGYFTGDDPRSDPRILNALERCGKLGTSAVERNDSVVLSDGSLPEDWERNPYSVLVERNDSIVLPDESHPEDWEQNPYSMPIIENDTLRVRVSYTGGGKAHEFSLIAWNYFLESYPVQAEILLSHNANGDSCEAVIKKTLAFDLSPLKNEYRRMYPNDSANKMILRLKDPSQPEGYLPLEYSFDANEAELVQSDRSRELSPDVTDAELHELVSGNNSFALDLYQSLRRQDGNLFYSPYSISLALAMTYTGARNETEQQMGNVCHFTLSQERLHPAFNAIDLELAERGKTAEGQDGKGFRLNIADSVWGQKGYDFLTSFLDVLAQNYGAGMQLLDFSHAPEDSRIIINNWVSEKTEGKIKDLIPQGDITDATRLVLTNAIYFNAAWEEPFQKDATRDAPFYLPDNTAVTVPMMSQGISLNYSEGDVYQAAELLYDGRDISMVILLPKPGQFEAFEASLTADRVNAITDDLGFSYVELKLPVFTYESDSIRLKDTLSEMGMPIPFIWPAADFSGMDVTKALFIGEVLHKGFISVNEAGTEAGAATAVIMPPGASPDMVSITVNRPFIFFIRDIKTHTILFVGRILDPT